MINFFNIRNIESCNSGSEKISEELKEIFNQTDRKYDMRYDRNFEEILIKLEKIEKKFLSSGKEIAAADCRFFKNYLLQALVQLGIVYRKKRQKKEALEVFGWVLCIDENNIDAMNNIDICNKKEVESIIRNLVNKEKKAVERENKNTKFAHLCNIKKSLNPGTDMIKKERGNKGE